MTKLRIHVLYEHGDDLKPFGCAYIRDLLPLAHPLNSEDLLVTKSTEYCPSDVIVLERMWKPGLTIATAEQLVEQIHIDQGCLVYSIDDNLLDLDQIPINTKMAIRFFCREADGVIVSTEYLKTRLQGLNKNIYVVPNAVDEQLFENIPKADYLPKNNDKRMIIGYMGTLTHDADLMMVLQSLRYILNKYSQTLEFQIVGAVSNDSILQAFSDLPYRVLQLSTENMAYPNFVKWMKQNCTWDLAIAPLEDTLFNKSKSDIKFLDYSALGIPGIYSSVPAYQEIVRHLDTGFLTANRPSDWSTALDFMLNDEQARKQIAQNALNYVFAERTLLHCAKIWEKAIYSIVNHL